MKRKYEGLIVLDTRGKEDTVDTIVSKIGRDMELEADRMQNLELTDETVLPERSVVLEERRERTDIVALDPGRQLS